MERLKSQNVNSKANKQANFLYSTFNTDLQHNVLKSPYLGENKIGYWEASPMMDPLRKSATPSSTPTHRARMKGRRRPHRKVQRSLAEPIRGVKIRPRMGLKNHVRL